MIMTIILYSNKKKDNYSNNNTQNNKHDTNITSKLNLNKQAQKKYDYINAILVMILISSICFYIM